MGGEQVRWVSGGILVLGLRGAFAGAHYKKK